MDDLSSYTREEKVLIYVYRIMADLVEAGIVSCGSARLTKKGKEMFKGIQDEGFKPTEREIVIAVMEIVENNE